MPGTFSQIYIQGISKNYYFFMTSPLIPLLYERKRIVFRDALQIVFAVKGRENLIGNSWKTDPISIGLINILPVLLKVKGISQLS